MYRMIICKLDISYFFNSQFSMLDYNLWWSLVICHICTADCNMLTIILHHTISTTSEHHKKQKHSCLNLTILFCLFSWFAPQIKHWWNCLTHLVSTVNEWYESNWIMTLHCDIPQNTNSKITVNKCTQTIKQLQEHGNVRPR